MMHGHEKSDPVIVAMKPTNKAGRPVAESMERRTGAKGNVDQQSTRRAQDRESVSQALDRVRQAARQKKEEKFTSLFHHLSIPMLRTAFFALKREAAPGVDGLTWQDYEADLDRRIEDLHARVHRGAYRAQPSRRRYIPKADGRQRPLAVAALEDKIVQRATVAVMNAIYEEDFLGFSYGFRPKRSQHDALDALIVGINSTKVNYILDADIRSFFDEVSQQWLERFVSHRIGDPRIIRLIQKWLKAGVMEDGKWSDTETGTPQGSVISPLLANIYLHYVFDLWVDVWRKKCARGEVIVLRYADDIVLGFQWDTDADRFRKSLEQRLGKFRLELHPEKTRRIEFGRYAEQNRKRRGEGKPETFDFLGFTHISGKNGNGSYAVRRMTIRKRMRKKLQEIKQQLKMRMHDPVPQTGAWLRSVVQGYYNYYAVPGNLDSLGLFRDRVLRYWGQALKRRSQRHRYAWARRLKLAAQWLPTPRVLHPWPLDRFAATIQDRSRMR